MKEIRKFDARPKLNGSYKFLDDYSKENMLHAQFLYSTCHHGLIREITFPENYNLSEFTIVGAKDIPGENIVPEPVSDQLFMADKEVFHYGQIIMGIAHADRRTLREFIKNVKIDYEELPAITDPKVCMDNLDNHFGREIIIDHSKCEEPDPTWKHHHTVYYTPHQEQAYLEPQGMLAEFNPEDKVMFIRATCQCPFFVKDGAKALLGNSVSEVIIETSEGIGGAFGGKEDFPSLMAGVTALLSMKSGRPVKMVLEREDDIQITTKRHPARIEIESWTNPEDNKIMKCRLDYRLDAGAYQTLSPVVLARGVLHSVGGYNIPDMIIKGKLMHSHTPSNGAFRGFGAPQAFAAMEAHVDNIAADFSVNPLKFRKANIFKLGDEFPTTQKVVEENLEHCLDRVIEKSEYLKKYEEFNEWNKTHKDKKGLGIGIGYHGGGYTGNGEKVLNSEVKVTVDKDAYVRIYVSNTDMGQGAHTTLAQMFFEAIDHPREKCWVQLPNTSKTPNSGPTVASRTIYIIGNLLRKMAKNMQSDLGFDKLEEYVAANQNDFPREFRMNFVPDSSIVFDEETFVGMAYKDYSWAAAVTEIYYHADTYNVELIKHWTVMDIGKVVNNEIARGQAEGGIVQGLGYGLSEYFHKPGYGRMHGFTDYTLPTTLDIPEIDVEFIHTDNPIAKGLGEIPMDYPAPSIRNAVLHALGIQVNEYPMTPERIMQELKNQPQTCKK